MCFVVESNAWDNVALFTLVFNNDSGMLFNVLTSDRRTPI